MGKDYDGYTPAPWKSSLALWQIKKWERGFSTSSGVKAESSLGNSTSARHSGHGQLAESHSLLPQSIYRNEAK